MSVHVSSWAWRQELNDPSAKLVLLKLADAANDDGICWPSQKTLAKHCEMSDRNVRFKLQKLEQAGLIVVKRTKRDDGGWAVNVYELPCGSPLPMPSETHRKPTSSETLIETKSFIGSPLPLECPECGLQFKDGKVGERQRVEHLENVHGVRAA